MKDILQADTWLSGVLKRDVYRMSISDKDAADGAGKTFLAGVMGQRGVFIYAKVPASSTTAIKFLENLNFHIVDTNVVFEKPVSAPNKLIGLCVVRFARPEDASEVTQLAGSAFTYSRFHLDDSFTARDANIIKAEWALNFFNGKRGTAMVVALVDGKIAGFLQLIQDNAGLLTIDLIAVDKNQRRKGIAKDMVAYAQNEAKAARTLRVGTQAANVASIRFYEDMAFRFTGASYVLHYHNK